MTVKFNYVIVSSTEGYQIRYYFSQLNRLFCLMPFYYVQNVYQKNQSGTRLII